VLHAQAQLIIFVYIKEIFSLEKAYQEAGEDFDKHFRVIIVY